MEKVRERLDEIATSAATTASEKAIAAAGESMLADMDKRFESLDGAIRTDIEETVSAAIKQALVAAKKVEGGRNELGFKWLDIPDGRKMALLGGTLDAAGCNIRMPNMTETAMTARGLRLKYELDQQNVDGGIVDNWMAWTNLVEGNPLREHCTVLPDGGGRREAPEHRASRLRLRGEPADDLAARRDRRGARALERRRHSDQLHRRGVRLGGGARGRAWLPRDRRVHLHDRLGQHPGLR